MVLPRDGVVGRQVFTCVADQAVDRLIKLRVGEACGDGTAAAAGNFVGKTVGVVAVVLLLNRGPQRLLRAKGYCLLYWMLVIRRDQGYRVHAEIAAGLKIRRAVGIQALTAAAGKDQLSVHVIDAEVEIGAFRTECAEIALLPLGVKIERIFLLREVFIKIRLRKAHIVLKRRRVVGKIAAHHRQTAVRVGVPVGQKQRRTACQDQAGREYEQQAAGQQLCPQRVCQPFHFVSASIL